MTKSLIILAVIAVVAGGGWFFVSSQKAEDVMMKKEEGAMMKDASTDAEGMMKKEDGEMMQKEDSMMKDEGAMMQRGGYETYAAEKLAKADTGDVVLFFRASWCPTCRAADADIRANLSQIPKGLTILDVNYDASATLKQKYGVTYQHTFVQVDSAGNQIAKWSGSPTLAEIVAHVK